MWNAWNIHHHHGRDQYWPIIKRSSLRRQKYVSALILFFVSDRWKILQEQQKDGKVKLKLSRSIRRTKTQWDSTENRLNSSGQVSQDFRHDLFFARFRTTWRQRTSSRRTSRTGSSSCQGSLTLYGKRLMRIVFRMPERSRITPWSSYQDIGRFWVQDQKKRYGDSHDQKGQWNCTANKMVQRFKDTAHPVFKSTSASSRGILKQRRGRCTIHFDGDFFKYRTLVPNSSLCQSAQCLRNSCEDSAWQKKKKDESLFLWTIKLWPWWSQKKWNCWYLLRPRRLETGCKEAHWASKFLEEGTVYTILSKKAFCQQLVIAGDYYKFRPNADDGWGSVSPLCREYSSSRSYPKTKALSAIP